MKSSYKILVVISFLLIALSVGSSFVNYTVSMKSTQNQLKTQSLPLSIDNIYTEIQKHMIEPFLVASMMAHDTFVQDWVTHEEDNVDKIQRYLDSIKNKYGMLATFLVSHKSQKYYTHNGFIETIDKTNPTNQWYFEFKNTPQQHEINLDLNEHLANTLIMFINFKMLDKNYNYIGATGVGIKISYINDMFKMFRDRYKLKVNFLDKEGNIILSENHNQKELKNIDSLPALAEFKDNLLSKNTDIIEYERDGYKYLIDTKYIEELDIYLLVEAKLDDFTRDTRKTFYFNMGTSLLLTFIIAFIIILIINGYHNRLTKLADYDTLTQIPNRRNFKDKFEYFLSLYKRNHQVHSLLFIDLDDFKEINDNYGHQVGDNVLEEFAQILKNSIRKTDICARWGGEEFVVAFIDTSVDRAEDISNKIREAVQNSTLLQEYVHTSVTISGGVTECNSDDTFDTLLTRADKAMYNAKTSGKNKICVP